MYGAINNPNKYHDPNCNPYCAHINNLDPIRKKNRLTVIDAVNVQYNGGPGFMANYMASYGGVVISDDPVAADRVGLEIIKHFRKVNRLPSLEEANRPVKYLKTASQLGLGESNISSIDVVVQNIDSGGNIETGELP